MLSRGDDLILRGTLGARFSDALCGSTAIRADAGREMLPLVEDDAWFFDTELVVPAERTGFRIDEVPVDRVDDPDSRVDIAATVRDDVRGVLRLLRGLAGGRLADRLPRARRAAAGRAGVLGQLARFAAVGVASTLAYVALYLLLRGGLGAQPADAVALLVTAVVSTAVNGRVTFGVSGRRRALRQHSEGLAVFGAALALTAGSLWTLGASAAHAGRAPELGVLAAANAAATVLRFVLLRAWVPHPARRGRAAAR